MYVSELVSERVGKCERAVAETKNKNERESRTETQKEYALWHSKKVHCQSTHTTEKKKKKKSPHTQRVAVFCEALCVGLPLTHTPLRIEQ